jgi:AcrR family transcriptional regulator
VPLAAGADPPEVAGPLIGRAVARSLAGRRASYADEVHRIVQATYEVVERTGSLDPTMRDILRQSGISTQAFYRHFRSKDELLLALLDDGRRQLSGYLAHRMAKAATPAGKVRAWIEGVLAQAGDLAAAARTRPFLANLDRLTEQYPEEQKESVELLIRLLEDALSPAEPGAPAARVRRDAVAVYHLTVGTMHQHIRDRTRPGPDEVEHVIQFSLAAVARPEKGERHDG